MADVRSRPARLGLLLTCLCLLALAVASPTAAQEPQRRTAVADGAATAAEAAAVPTGITPLIGDFDGDHRSDVFMYGPGSLPDHVWLGRPDRAFRGAAVNVGRNYLPLVGDFNGNGHADILWYGPGPSPDVLWYGKTDGAFSGSAVNVAGTYEPLLGDFNGDGENDIFWYGPGAGEGRAVVPGKASGGFSGRAVTVHGYYQPLVADFGGDGYTDIFWYGPGHTARTTSGRGARRAPSRSCRPCGRHLPPSPVTSTGTGAATSSGTRRAPRPTRCGTGIANGHFTGQVPVDVSGTYSPVVGEFTGDGHRHHLVRAGHAPDAAWHGQLRRRLHDPQPERRTAPTGPSPATSTATVATTSSGTPRGGTRTMISCSGKRQSRVRTSRANHPGHRPTPVRPALRQDSMTSPRQPSTALRGLRRTWLSTGTSTRRAAERSTITGRSRLLALRGRHGPAGRCNGPGRRRRASRRRTAGTNGSWDVIWVALAGKK